MQDSFSVGVIWSLLYLAMEFLLELANLKILSTSSPSNYSEYIHMVFSDRKGDQ